jgi:hypothetical protein
LIELLTRFSRSRVLEWFSLLQPSERSALNDMYGLMWVRIPWVRVKYAGDKNNVRAWPCAFGDGFGCVIRRLAAAFFVNGKRWPRTRHESRLWKHHRMDGHCAAVGNETGFFCFFPE